LPEEIWKSGFAFGSCQVLELRGWSQLFTKLGGRTSINGGPFDSSLTTIVAIFQGWQ
jgi:hypothetical protein